MAKIKILSVGGTSKGLNIFKSETYKEHEQKPMAALFWKMRWAVGIWIACAVAFGLAFAIEHVWRVGFSPATWKWLGLYFQNMLFSGGLSVIAEIPSWIMRMVLRTDIPTLAPLLPIIVYGFLAHTVLMEEFNPHGKDKFDEKSSNKANENDILKMKWNFKNKLGLFGGFMMVLGYFKLKGKVKPLMFDETLSALCVAPPGTGKTAGVVIPTILDCDGVSMIINDPKPELDEKTSGYRSTVGPVFIMNWAGQDDPVNGVYYPSWNPLSPEHVPFLTEKRDLYIDSMCKTLIPDKGGSSADPHWTISGRSALAGLVHFIVSKIERAKADDYFVSRLQTGTFDAEDAGLLNEYYQMMAMQGNTNALAAMGILEKGQLNTMNYVHVGTWANIPDSWLGKEASLSMILDWINKNQVRLAEELEERKKQGDQMVMMADSMKDLFLDAVNEARQYAYAHRAVLELTQLANTPDKERGSILSTVMAGLNIFRNTAVRNRTSHSDFHFGDLRGIKNPQTGKWEPVTVYLSINMVDADAVNPITGIFIELMSAFLLVNTPDGEHAGQKLGPCPVLFVLDEMPKMQKLDAVIQGPDLGRGQKISYLLIGQDIHQIQEKYGADAAATIMSTTAAKIILRQNDYQSAETFARMIGSKMEKKEKKDDKGKVSEETVTKELYTPYDIMRLPEGKQITLIQGWYHRPIEADQERHFLRKNPTQISLDDKVKMGRANPLPDSLIASHHAAMGYGGVPRIRDIKTGEVKELVPTTVSV